MVQVDVSGACFHLYVCVKFLRVFQNKTNKKRC